MLLKRASLVILLLWSALSCAGSARADEPPKATDEVQKLLDIAARANKARHSEEALKLYGEARMRAHNLQDRKGEADALRQLGNVSDDLHAPRKALEYYSQSLGLFRQIGDRTGEGKALVDIGLIYRQLKRWPKALEYFLQGRTVYRAHADKQSEADADLVIGKLYYETNDHEKALEYFQQAQPLYHNVGNEQSEALVQKEIGYEYKELGQFTKALEAYNQALQWYTQAADESNQASTLLQMGAAYFVSGQFERGRERFDRALALYKQLKDKNGEASTLTSLGLIDSISGQQERAVDRHRQALILFREIGDKHAEAHSLSAAGLVYADLGEMQKALEYYRQAVPLYHEAGDAHFEALRLSDIGSIYRQMGEPQKALEYVHKAMQLYQKTNDKAGEANALNNLGFLYFDINQIPRAREYFALALPIYKKLNDKKQAAAGLLNIANMYYDSGQTETSLPYYEQALAMNRQLGDRGGEAGVLTQIGVLYAGKKDHSRALDYYSKALPLYRDGGNPAFEILTLKDIAQSYHALKQTEKAQDYYSQALALCRKIGDRGTEADTLDDIAAIQIGLGEFKPALATYGQALALYREVNDPQRVADNLGYMGTFERKMRDTANADAHLMEAVSLLETLRRNFGGLSDAKSAFLSSRLYAYYEYLNLLLDERKPEEAFAIAQKTKSRSLLDLLFSGRVDLSKSLTPEERLQEKDLQMQADHLNTAMAAEGVKNEVGAKARYAAFAEKLRGVESQLQILEDTLYSRHPDLTRRRVASTATAGDVARFLPEDTALLEYIQNSGKTVVLFVVTVERGQARVQTFPIEATDLARRAAQCRAGCSDPRSPYQEAARGLYDVLISPAASAIAGKKRLLICPDGPMWDVPFASLLTPAASPGSGRQDSSQFLAEQFEIDYAYSATGAQAALAARAHSARAMPAGTMLAFANPDFGTVARFGDLKDLPGQRPIAAPSRPIAAPSRPIAAPSRPFERPSRPIAAPSRPIAAPSRPIAAPSRYVDLPSRGNRILPLPGTQQEADALKHDFKDATVLTGRQAQETAAKKQASQYRYLHFATHGFFNDTSPLLSSIVLAQPEPGSHEDGFLTAREIFDLNLHCDMVVLSACNTARGQLRTGDGLIGLTWALFAAGAPTQVVSQWSVDDASTATLMQNFYAGLTKSHMAKGQALRQAELALMRDGKHRHPYYWAPFVLLGDWN